MDIVIDASVFIATIANEPEKDRLIQATKGANLIVLPSIHWEIGNAFSAMLKRNRISFDQVLDPIDIYYQIPNRFASVELEESLQLAAEKNKIYAYYAYIIRWAVKYQAALLSLDKNLLTVANAMGVKVIEVRI